MTRELRCWQAATWYSTKHRRFRFIRNSAIWVDYGITPVEAVRTATYNAASVLGIEMETGSLKEGLAGDLLVVKGDVSKNIRALDDVLEVYLAGKTVYTV